MSTNNSYSNVYGYTCDGCNDSIEGGVPVHYIDADYGDAVVYDRDGEMVSVHTVCSACAEKWHEGAGFCYRCRKSDIPLPQLNYIGDDIVCSSCVERHYFYCGDCEMRFYKPDNNYYITHGSRTICESCYEDGYFTCDDCGDVYDNDRCYDSGLCENCHDNQDDDRLIHDYSYKPMPEFIGKGKLFFGCELEVNVSDRYSLDEKAQEVLDALNTGSDEEDHAYLKSDSSIGRGFEIVTHPHSYDEIRKLWLEKWKDNIQGITSHNSGNCGFHVHVSRKALTSMHVQKLIVFINAPENASLVRFVAQRNCDNWGIIKNNKLIGHCGHSDDRYEAINLLNRHTIEFRIFRGNIRKDRIMKNLEFVKAAIDFTRDRSYRDLSGDNFRSFVGSRKKEFKYLYEFLQNSNEANSGNSNNI